MVRNIIQATAFDCRFGAAESMDLVPTSLFQVAQRLLQRTRDMLGVEACDFMLQCCSIEGLLLGQCVNVYIYIYI